MGRSSHLGSQYHLAEQLRGMSVEIRVNMLYKSNNTLSLPRVVYVEIIAFNYCNFIGDSLLCI